MPAIRLSELLTGTYGTLTINEDSGAYSYDPDDAAILALTSNASETFTLSVTDDTTNRVNQILTIEITAIDNLATISRNINDALNTVADEGVIDLGTITISDVDSARNLQLFDFFYEVWNVELDSNRYASDRWRISFEFNDD